MELKRTPHAVYELNYHFVFASKYRRNVISDEINQRLKALFAEIADHYDFEIIEQEIMEDHIHLLISAPPRYAPAQLMNILKSISAKQLFKEFPLLKKQCWSASLWEEGYFVRAVGDKVTKDVVQRYVRYQREHGKQLDLFK
jgi:putative transposase